VEDLARREVLVADGRLDPEQPQQAAGEADRPELVGELLEPVAVAGEHADVGADDQVDGDRELARLADVLGVPLELVERRRRVAGDEEIPERPADVDVDDRLALRLRRAVAQPGQERAGRALEERGRGAPLVWSSAPTTSNAVLMRTSRS
jgi:hypothetical protein